MRASQVALHARTRLAFDAAARAGLAGRFDAFEDAGLLATLTTAPGLGFLNQVAGVSGENLEVLPDVLMRFRTGGAAPPSLLLSDAGVDDTVAGWLRARGYVPAGHRPMAVLDLTADRRPPGDEPVGLTVQPAATTDMFLDVLAAGYGAPAAVRDFMAAEHADPSISRYVAAGRDGRPVAVAAMSVHGDVAVLGGATVLPGERGRGYQSQLLDHRLRAAREAGCVAAVATAAPDSPSAVNLRRAGFAIELRVRWVDADQAVSST